MARLLSGEELAVSPETTMLGALLKYLREADPKHFQPMNANFGLLPDLPVRVKDKQKKKEMLAERALAAMREFAGQAASMAA
jgi:methylenetetrahydrofolate--tRNA-(uracil-5-)-methyltransferase